MKHLKTFFAVIAMLVLTFTFAACGTNTDNGNNADVGNNGSITESGGNQNGSSSGSNDGSSSGGNENEGNENTGNESQNPSEGENNGNESQTPSGGNESGDGQDTPDETDGKILVVYFSATNNTESVAQKIQTATGADIYEILAAVPYTTADLNYNTDCRANREQNDPTARPEINGNVENISQYDTVFIGYPIWWGQAPKIIYTFLESYDFSGKTLITFCTSASSGMGSSSTNLHSSATGATWIDGQRFSSSVSQSTIMTWVNGLNY